MPEQSPIYALPTGLQADDLIQPAHHNRIADTLDRVLGSALQKLLAAGPLSGWLLTENAQVSAGEGLVAGCWCHTDAPADISGLTDGLVNYIFALPTAHSADAGQVAFAAAPTVEGGSGGVLLGTVTLDAQGQVTAVDSHAEGVERDLRRLQIRTISGAAAAMQVPAETTVTVAVDHSQQARLAMPGAIELQGAGEGFECEIRGAWQAGGFAIAVTNTGEQAADFACTWKRQGIC